MQSRRHAGKSPAAVAMRYAAAEWPFDCCPTAAPASGGTEGWSVEFRWPAILYRRESGALPSRSVIPSCAPSSAPIRALPD
jgi:hypothetical protein